MSKLRFRDQAKKLQEAEFIESSVEGEELSLLETFEAAGIPLAYGCREGSCGSCLVKVCAGEELLTPPTPMEMDTLSRVEDPASKRLACRAKIRKGAAGDIELESGWKS